MSKILILFLAANPRTSEPLAIGEEARDIENKLQAVKFRDAFDFESKWAVRAEDLQNVLLNDRPTIVHFSGHGSGVKGIVLHGASEGDETLVDGEALKGLFRALKDDIKIVVLNACYSEEQAKAVVEEIDFVIGMKDEIGDQAARQFAASFYRALGFGKSIKNAFDLGLNELQLQGQVKDVQDPVLLTKPGVDPAAVTLVERPGGLDGDRIRALMIGGSWIVLSIVAWMLASLFPIFKSLIDVMDPNGRRVSALGLGMAMGVFGVAFQFVPEERLNAAFYKTWFTRTIIVLGISSFCLLGLLQTTIIRVPTPEGEASFVLGFGDRREDCHCNTSPDCPNGKHLGDAECIQRCLPFTTGAIETCWGKQVIIASTLILFSYLFMTASAAVLLGLVLQREAQKRRLRQ
ncbi:MAG TPA: CHAT domain-containing protein [Polyangiaceae bacterium]|nr:CHAT domain-containing protein [Polyangiaceae bacterium]